MSNRKCFKGKRPTGQCDECQEEEPVSHVYPKPNPNLNLTLT